MLKCQGLILTPIKLSILIIILVTWITIINLKLQIFQIIIYIIWKKNLNLDNFNYNFCSHNFKGNNNIKYKNIILPNNKTELNTENIFNKIGIYNIKYINDRKNDNIEKEKNEIILKTFRTLYSTDNKINSSIKINYNNKTQLNYNIKLYEEGITKNIENKNEIKNYNDLNNSSNNNSLNRSNIKDITKEMKISKNTSIEEINKLKGDLEKLNSNIKNLESNTKELISTNNNLEIEYNDLKLSKEKSDNVIIQLNNKIKEENEFLGKIIKDKDILNNKLNKDLINTNEEKNKLKKEIDKLKNGKKDNNDKNGIENLKNQIKNLNLKINEIEKEKQNLKEELNDAKNKLGKNKMFDGKINDFEEFVKLFNIIIKDYNPEEKEKKEALEKIKILLNK